jgi:hypothetical protein
MMPKQRGPGALAGAAEAGGDHDMGDSVPITAFVQRPQPREAAFGYASRGWAIVPIPCGEKRPAMPGWPDFDARPEHVPRLFGHGENIAVILGPKSGDLADIDLDCHQAIELADLYLPATRAVFGRASKPRSHRLFIASGAFHETFADPTSGKTLLELRAAGRDGGAHLTLLPPSITDGERREWDGDIIAPAVIEAIVLRTAVAWLAIGCLVMRYVSETAARNPAPDLPRLLWEADQALGRRAFDWLGLPHPDLPRRYPRERQETTHGDLDFAEMVAAIPNTFDWHEWNAVSMAVYTASGGSDDGFIAFDDLSARSRKYLAHVVVERWRNYHRSPPCRTGIGKLIALALAAGWRPSGGRNGPR